MSPARFLCGPCPGDTLCALAGGLTGAHACLRASYSDAAGKDAGEASKAEESAKEK